MKLWHTLVPIRPIRRDPDVIDPDVIDPDVYGSERSLREMTADDSVHNYFQLADRDRYLKMFEGRFVLAISRIMREAGYSSASFDRAAATVVNNNVHIDTNTGIVQISVGTNTIGSVHIGQQQQQDEAAPPQPVARAPRLLLMIDVVGYGRRSALAREDVQERLLALLRTALEDVGVAADGVEDDGGAGDGITGRGCGSARRARRGSYTDCGPRAASTS